MRKIIVLLSGGMDSVTGLYEALSQSRKYFYSVAGCISFHYGSKHNDREIPYAAYHALANRVPHQVIHLDFINKLFTSDLLASGGEIPKGHYEEESMKKTVVPFRNGIMLAVAAGYAESQKANSLLIASHAGDHAIYPDCREDFMKAMAQAIYVGTYAQIELIRPFIAMTKAEICKKGVERYGIDYGKTWSCYLGGHTHCGECGTCVERREAFLVAGIEDPTKYLNVGPLPEKPVACV